VRSIGGNLPKVAGHPGSFEVGFKLGKICGCHFDLFFG
jgi:hypothetical protein